MKELIKRFANCSALVGLCAALEKLPGYLVVVTCFGDPLRHSTIVIVARDECLEDAPFPYHVFRLFAFPGGRAAQDKGVINWSVSRDGVGLSADEAFRCVALSAKNSWGIARGHNLAPKPLAGTVASAGCGSCSSSGGCASASAGCETSAGPT